MRKFMFFGFYVCVFYFLFLVFSFSMVGCGQQATQEPTPATEPTPTLTGGISSISGTLSLGNFTQSVGKGGIKTQAVAYDVQPDYTVTAVGKTSGTIYFSPPTDSSGNFTISNLPSKEAFYLEVLDDSNRLAAPVAFGPKDGGLAVTVAPSSDAVAPLNLGSVVLDTSKDTAAPVTPPTPNLDSTATVEAKSGETLVPKGAGNFGKGTEPQFTGTYDSSKIDGDKDGLPNIVDADNNGDLVADEFDGLYSKEASAASDSKISHSFLFTNMKISYGYSNTYQDDYSEFSPAIGIFPKSGYTISKAYLSEGPSWVTKAKIVGGDNLWKDMQPIAYSLGEMPDGVFVQHLHNLIPTKEVNAGDVLKFKVEFSDGSSEEVIKMVNFVFTDIPRLVEYHLGPSSNWTAAPAPTGGHQNLSEATTLEVYLRWHRPKDENGNEIIGGRYTWEYWPAKAGQGQEVTIISLDSGAATTLEGSYNFYGLISDEAAAEQNFNIGICIRNDNNDNAGQNIGFVKGW